MIHFSSEGPSKEVVFKHKVGKYSAIFIMSSLQDQRVLTDSPNNTRVTFVKLSLLTTGCPNPQQTPRLQVSFVLAF